MDRYRKNEAARRIDGYYLPAPHECSLGTQEEAFNRAKEEVLLHLERYKSDVEELTYSDFKSCQRNLFRS